MVGFRKKKIIEYKEDPFQVIIILEVLSSYQKRQMSYKILLIAAKEDILLF